MPTIHRSPSPWLIRCVRGLYRVVVDELRFRRLLPPATEPLVLRQRNHDLLFVPRLRYQPDASRVRTAEQILRCLIYGRYKVSVSQLDRLAAELKSAATSYHLAVSAEGTHFTRRDFGSFLERELGARGVVFDREAAAALFVFCVDASYYVGVLSSGST